MCAEVEVVKRMYGGGCGGFFGCRGRVCLERYILHGLGCQCVSSALQSKKRRDAHQKRPMPGSRSTALGMRCVGHFSIDPARHDSHHDLEVPYNRNRCI